MPKGRRRQSARLLLAVVAVSTFLLSAVTKPSWQFVDRAAEAGLTSRNECGDELHKKYILEMNGSGIGFIDYDRDGYPDLFIVNGTRFDRSPGAATPTSHFYRNNRNGTFSDVTEQAGLSYSGWGQAVCVGDYDNDGWDDLFVSYYGRNKLFRNLGNGKFSDVSERSGVAGENDVWNTGCTFTDYDRDGKLDLFVTSYVDLGPNLSGVPTPGSGEFCRYKGIPIACGPRGLKPGVNHLFHNEGNGVFADVSGRSGIRNTQGHYGLGVLSIDYDSDGWPDIYVACDSAASTLFRNNHDGTFRDVGLASGTAFNDDGEPQAGMGIASADYDHDGQLDIVKTNFSDDSPILYRNNGHGTFTDHVFDGGLGRPRTYMGWGVSFLDFDNDGWSDIFMANGHLSAEIDASGSDSRYRQQRLLYRNLHNGHFENVSASAGPALCDLHSSRGAAVADISNDGRLAIAVNEMHEHPSLLVLEHPPSNHWLGIRTIGAQSNRDGIGARVEVRAGDLRQIDEVRSGGSYLSQNDLRLHFGLGAHPAMDELRVTWPSGHIDRWVNIPADQQIAVTEGDAKWRAAR